MTEFSKALKEYSTSKRVSIRQPFSFREESYVDPTVGIVYRILATISTEVTMVDYNEHAIRNAKRSLVEFMFGEFRRPLIDLQLAIDSYDYATAARIAQEIERNMYEI